MRNHFVWIMKKRLFRPGDLRRNAFPFMNGANEGVGCLFFVSGRGSSQLTGERTAGRVCSGVTRISGKERAASGSADCFLLSDRIERGASGQEEESSRLFRAIGRLTFRTAAFVVGRCDFAWRCKETLRMPSS